MGGVRPNINEDGHAKFSKRVTFESCNTESAMAIFRLRGAGRFSAGNVVSKADSGRKQGQKADRNQEP